MNEFEKFSFVKPVPNILLFVSENREVLRITPEGEVIAPSLEDASEAGRVFVESIRHHIEAIRSEATNGKA